MKKIILATMLLSAPVFAKPADPAVIKATLARDAARQEVIKAQIAVARAKAVLAERQLTLTQAKYAAGASRAAAEQE